MKIKIISVRLPRLFNGERLPSFTDKEKYFVKYKKHYWEKYRYMKNRFVRPMGFTALMQPKCISKRNV